MLVVGSSYAQTIPQKSQQEKKARMEQRGMRADKAKKSPEEMAQMRTERLAKKLELTASQKNQLQALNLRHVQEMKAQREGLKGTEDKAQKRAAMKASREKYHAELKGMLSAEQYAKYEVIRAEKRAKHRERKTGFEGQRSGENQKQRS